MNFYMLAKIAPTADLDISQTAGVIISGLAVVFLVLLLLVGFVSLFGSFFKKGKKEPPVKQAPPPKQETKKPVPPPVPVAEDDSDEIIAVISAVVAQMSIEDGKQYRIKSVKAKNQKSSGRPVWASEGLRQNTNPF
ncbi:MAG: OadG family transporter subunit [Ruminococcus sp.]|nr:OadG family transporter subunit [Oscillospiraceae bacterium]MDY4412991.1 OadG family transporter subunit [Ruminococcus sp.]